MLYQRELLPQDLSSRLFRDVRLGLSRDHTFHRAPQPNKEHALTGSRGGSGPRIELGGKGL